MATASAARAERPLPHGVPVLRWIYRRDGDTLQCELALTADLSAYELRLAPSRFAPGPPSELFDDAVGAFQHQTRLEAALIRDGWHLERFENDRQG